MYIRRQASPRCQVPILISNIQKMARTITTGMWVKGPASRKRWRVQHQYQNKVLSRHHRPIEQERSRCKRWHERSPLVSCYQDMHHKKDAECNISTKTRYLVGIVGQMIKKGKDNQKRQNIDTNKGQSGKERRHMSMLKVI